MCGIVGYIGKNNAKDVLIEGLKRLEYRGYDSAGIAIVNADAKKKIAVVRAVGKVSALDEKAQNRKLAGAVGIAHTRWATHGKPSVANAHPHSAGKITLVHNGIIENYQALKNDLIKKKHVFSSQTDSEVVAHLIEEECKKSSFEDAVYQALKQVKGAYALVIVNSDEPEKVIAVRNSSPLVLGIGEGEYIFASDPSAIMQHTKDVIYLDDGEVVIASKKGYTIKTLAQKVRHRSIQKLEWDDEQVQKEGYPHFMLKEIFEQPHAIADALRGRTEVSEGLARLGGLQGVTEHLKKIERIIIISCGTSYNAGLVGEYMFEEYAGIPTEVEYASEYRYRKPLLNEKTAVLAISQSGETADTLAAMREAKRKGALTLGIVNAVGSTIARDTDAGVYNHAGPEISVASTKAFTSQLSIIVLLTVLLGRQRDMSFTMGKRILTEMKKIPRQIEQITKLDKQIKKLAQKYRKYDNILYMGRKYNFPIALEGALKIKEISYVHAEGYAAGEMKHGPIALIDKNFPSIIIAPKDSVYDKTVSGIEEIRARGGQVIVVTTKGAKELGKIADDIIEIPKTLEMLMPILCVVPLQLFAYHFGVARGLDVDQPRNLAKSVTVE